MKDSKPEYVVNSSAPIRICDLGGWTDTWFAGYGCVFNIGVQPRVEVQLAIYPAHLREHHIVINAENFGERYALPAGGRGSGGDWIRHPLLEAVIEAVPPPADIAIEATIYSVVPAGASTGTSAAVAVALISALDQLTPGRMTSHEIAVAALRVEAEILNQQSGVQDQLCSAYGGLNHITVDHYPHATVSQIQLPDDVWWELERRLVLIYLGDTHQSTQVHEMVIRDLEGAGPNDTRLEELRQTAPIARDALLQGDFAAFGQAMIRNNDAQKCLHPSLISADAERVIEIVRDHDAIGWKVNGAGGEGGTLTVLCSLASSTKHAMIREIEGVDLKFRNIPISLSRDGLRVWRK